MPKDLNAKAKHPPFTIGVTSVSPGVSSGLYHGVFPVSGKAETETKAGGESQDRCDRQRDNEERYRNKFKAALSALANKLKSEGNGALSNPDKIYMILQMYESKCGLLEKAEELDVAKTRRIEELERALDRCQHRCVAGGNVNGYGIGQGPDSNSDIGSLVNQLFPGSANNDFGVGMVDLLQLDLSQFFGPPYDETGVVFPAHL